MGLRNGRAPELPDHEEQDDDAQIADPGEDGGPPVVRPGAAPRRRSFIVGLLDMLLDQGRGDQQLLPLGGIDDRGHCWIQPVHSHRLDDGGRLLHRHRERLRRGGNRLHQAGHWLRRGGNGLRRVGNGLRRGGDGLLCGGGNGLRRWGNGVNASRWLSRQHGRLRADPAGLRRRREGLGCSQYDPLGGDRGRPNDASDGPLIGGSAIPGPPNLLPVHVGHRMIGMVPGGRRLGAGHDAFNELPAQGPLVDDRALRTVRSVLSAH